MSINPTSFRFPFSLPEEVHPEVRRALRLTYQGVADLNQAIAALVPKVNANTASSTTINQTITASTGSGGGGSTFPVFGDVNLQPNLTPGAYSFVQADLAGLIVVNSSVAFALTLNSGLMLPFFTTVFNVGAGSITATPSTGVVNNASSVPLSTNQFAIFYFDGTNWWALQPGTSSAANSADAEVPAGSGTAFTLVNPPNPALSLKLYVGGGRLTQGVGNDYTLSGNAITLATALPVGVSIVADYRF